MEICRSGRSFSISLKNKKAQIIVLFPNLLSKKFNLKQIVLIDARSITDGHHFKIINYEGLFFNQFLRIDASVFKLHSDNILT